MSFEGALQALSAGDELEAEKQLRRVVEKAKIGASDAGSAELSLGLLLERQGRLDEAAEWLGRATTLKTDPMQRALSRKIQLNVVSRLPGREREIEEISAQVEAERVELLGSAAALS